MKLTDEQLLQVISVAPLVSIDLVIRDSEGRILLGRRVNNPAKGTWFVPGGRIYKNEDLDEAFERICIAEVGQTASRSDAKFIGPFTHIYGDNFTCTDGIGTHYVVLAYELHLTKQFILEKSAQHSEFKWFAPDDVDSDIHKNSRNYLRQPSRIDEAQYAALNARRDSFNNQLWQTPVLSLTAQAFLFTIVLSADVSILAQKVASALAFFIALASVQLLAKHRFMERRHAVILDKHEKALGRFGANSKEEFLPDTWVTEIRSHILWAILLGLFAIAAAVAFLFPVAFAVGNESAP
jgi:colanic acid biosynthesis protein WcaH